MNSIRVLLILALILLPFIGRADNGSIFHIVSENNLQGLVDQHGNVVIPIEYEELGWSSGADTVHQDVIGYRKQGKWGLISITNELVTEPLYVQLSPFRENLLLAARENNGQLRFGMINPEGRVRISFIYSALEETEDPVLLASLEKSGTIRMGVIDFYEKSILPIEFYELRRIPAGYAGRINRNSWKLFQKDGTPLSGLIIDGLEVFPNGNMSGKINGSVGLLSSNGSVLHEFEYKSVSQHGQVRLQFDQWEVLDGKLNSVFLARADSIEMRGDQYLGYFNGTPSFLGNNQSNPEIPNSLKSPLKYDSLLYQEDRIWAGKLNGSGWKWYLLDEDGRRLHGLPFSHVGEVSTDLYTVSRHGKWGLINPDAREVIPITYDSIGRFHGDFAVARKESRLGILDRSGQWRTYAGIRELTQYTDSLFLFRILSNFGILHVEKGILYQTADSLSHSGEIVLQFEDTLHFSLVNNQGILLDPGGFDSLVVWKDQDFAAIYGTQVFAYFPEEGRLDSPGRDVEEIYPAREGYFPVKIGGKYGFHDDQYRLRISNRYDSVKQFQFGLAPVKIRGRWGLINKSENIIIQPLYDDIRPVNEDHYIFRKGTGYGMISAAGNQLLPPSYEQIIPLSDNLLLIQQNGRVGLSDYNGFLVVRANYDDLEVLPNGHVMARKGSKWGLLSTKGVTLIAPKYQQLIYHRETNQYFTRLRAEPEK